MAVAEADAEAEAVAEADAVADTELVVDGAAVPVLEADTVASAVQVPVLLCAAVPDLVGAADPLELGDLDLGAVRETAGVAEAVVVLLADLDASAVKELVAVEEPVADGDDVVETEPEEEGDPLPDARLLRLAEAE